MMHAMPLKTLKMTRRCRLSAAFFVSLALAACASAQTTPLERIERTLGPHLDAADPFGLPMKVRALAAGEYKFWRGSKDLYFDWCKSNCRDWLGDEGAYVVGHGDLHLGNIGTYLSDESLTGGAIGKPVLGFGMVDYHDSARVPFQTELLQGLITMRLIARENAIDWTPKLSADVTSALVEKYRFAINARSNAARLLDGDADVAKLLAKAAGGAYGDEVAAFSEGGKLRERVVNKKGKTTDLLRRFDASRRTAVAAALAEAAANDERLARLLGTRSATDLAPRVKDAAVRTRIESSGSQGLAKILVLVRPPQGGAGGELLVYLKQQVPAAAERSGAVPHDPRSPGERCARDADALVDPPLAANSWCMLEGKSFWAGVKEPWSDELSTAAIRSESDLLRAAALWGSVAGAAHRTGGAFDRVRPRLTEALAADLTARADAYVAEQARQFESFNADPRMRAMIVAADAAIRASQQ